MDSFFGIGVFELVFIIIFALIFLGPERLPSVMREVIGFLRKVRELSSEVTQQFSDEFGDLQDLQELDPRRQIQKALQEPSGQRTERKTASAKKGASKQTGTKQASSKETAKQTAKQTASKAASSQPSADAQTTQFTSDTNADTNTSDTNKDEVRPQVDARAAFGSGAADDPTTSEASQEQPQAGHDGDDEHADAVPSSQDPASLPQEKSTATGPSPKPRKQDTQISPASAYFAKRETENGKANEPVPEPEPEHSIAPPPSSQSPAKDQSTVERDVSEEEQR